MVCTGCHWNRKYLGYCFWKTWGWHHSTSLFPLSWSQVCYWGQYSSQPLKSTWFWGTGPLDQYSFHINLNITIVIYNFAFSISLEEIFYSYQTWFLSFSHFSFFYTSFNAGDKSVTFTFACTNWQLT